MGPLQAVRKHDGRVVAFDLERLSASITQAAYESGERVPRDAAQSLGNEMALAAGSFLAQERTAPPATSDLREMVQRLLRETGHAKTAGAYAEHARSSAALLWRMRLFDDAAGAAAWEGATWDRRRLIESLRGAGVARDPAGEVAREVERRLLVLAQARISAALIHALAMLALSERGLDPRAYAARRISASFSGLAPRYDKAAATERPLPSGGPALEAFWLQAVHSSEVSSAARGHVLGLEPYPSAPASERSGLLSDGALDPLQASAGEALTQGFRSRSGPASGPDREAHGGAGALSQGELLWLRADDPARIATWARHLAGLAEMPSRTVERGPWGEGAFELGLVLRWAPHGASPACSRQAPVLTLNIGSALVREALRDPVKVNRKLASLATLGAHAHREREEYWGFSAVRGRELPIAAAGLWNAAAWLTGEPYERGARGQAQRESAANLAAGLHGAVSTLRQETGMNLRLVSNAPRAAAAALWRRDRLHFARDGLHLDSEGAYETGLDLKLSAGTTEVCERIEFLRNTASFFDAPPALCVEAPLGLEPDPAAWREFLTAMALTGVPRVRVAPGGSGRSMRLLTRLVRSHMEGYPLFAQEK